MILMVLRLPLFFEAWFFFLWTESKKIEGASLSVADVKACLQMSYSTDEDKFNNVSVYATTAYAMMEDTCSILRKTKNLWLPDHILERAFGEDIKEVCAYAGLRQRAVEHEGHLPDLRPRFIDEFIPLWIEDLSRDVTSLRIARAFHASTEYGKDLKLSANEAVHMVANLEEVMKILGYIRSGRFYK